MLKLIVEHVAEEVTLETFCQTQGYTVMENLGARTSRSAWRIGTGNGGASMVRFIENWAEDNASFRKDIEQDVAGQLPPTRHLLAVQQAFLFIHTDHSLSRAVFVTYTCNKGVLSEWPQSDKSDFGFVRIILCHLLQAFVDSCSTEIVYGDINQNQIFLNESNGILDVLLGGVEIQKNNGQSRYPFGPKADTYALFLCAKFMYMGMEDDSSHEDFLIAGLQHSVSMCHLLINMAHPIPAQRFGPYDAMEHDVFTPSIYMSTTSACEKICELAEERGYAQLKALVAQRMMQHLAFAGTAEA